MTEEKRVEMIEHADGKVVEVLVSGKLEKQDYETFVPAFERLIEKHGKIRTLFELKDFSGWTAGALWEDLKFDFEHRNDIERLAIVGDKAWEKGMATFCKPFTSAEVRFFEPSRVSEAQNWLMTV